MNKEQKKQRKRKKREERKKKQNQKISYPDFEFNTSMPEYMPDKNDRKAWSRLSKMRDAKAIIKRAFELYPKEKILREFRKYGFGCVQTKKEMYNLNDVFTAAAQSLYSDPPFYIPIVSVSSHGMRIEHVTPKKRNGKAGSIYCNIYEEDIVVDGITYRFGFSTHAMERLYERMSPCLGITRLTVFSFLLRFIGLGEPTSSGDVHRVPLLLGDKIFGYCPCMIEDDNLVAKTFLLPGMQFAPELDIYAEVEIKDAMDLVEKCPQILEDDRYFDYTNSYRELVNACKKTISKYDETEET